MTYVDDRYNMTAADVFDLECTGISKEFGDFRAVDDVSFRIPSGTFFSILGPSGCGKTTLMRMIAGFEDPTRGDISIKGVSVLSTPPNKRNVKMVFQHLALFPMMDVYDNIAYGLRCAGAAKEEIARRVADVLERVALPDLARREIHQLSGGQKQRIAIARCMALNPDVLLLDEPLGALDLKLREAMKIELKLLQHQFDTTFVYITHDQSEALVMSDYVAVMNAGRFEQVGRPEELYHAPKTAFVAGFVGDSNRWKGRALEVRSDGIKVETDAGLSVVATAYGESPIAEGAAVEIYVRPEFISATKPGEPTPPAAGENEHTGTIDSVLFNGANSRVLVRSPSGTLIEADVVVTGSGEDVREGDPVRLTWARAQSMCFSV